MWTGEAASRIVADLKERQKQSEETRRRLSDREFFARHRRHREGGGCHKSGWWSYVFEGKRYYSLEISHGRARRFMYIAESVE